jgi:signal transduction histidine kinase
MNWLLADKERLFWMLQISGWIGFFILHVSSVSTFIAGRSPVAWYYSGASSLIGFAMTSIFARPIYRFARHQGPILLLVIAIAATVSLAGAMSAMKAQTLLSLFNDDWLEWRSRFFRPQNLYWLILPDVQATVFLMGSWAGFYFGINYYLDMRGESERAVLAAHLADQAQLKMLRYQLNPHFLFNTLNAISTLVLERECKQADIMISRLSAFLRYSLDSDPLQKTSLAEEIRALKLYLEIEETRFGERLRVNFDIDDDALDARVPSLILQPAIENAIKYAIAKMEGNGQITISAKRKGQMLVMEVSDNGPDAPADPSELIRNAKNGVGLVNMRERLALIYQGQCEFTLSRRDPQGLCVSLMIPFET